MNAPAKTSSTPITVTVIYDRNGSGSASPPRRVAILLTPDLAAVFARAAVVNANDSTPLSFTSLLIGLLTGSDEISQWLKPELGRRGVTVDKIARRASRSVNESELNSVAGGDALPELGASISARRAIEEAQNIAGELGNPALDVRHLAAAYPILPGWHVEDFKELGIDRLAWCREFGTRMANSSAAEKWYWRDYVDRASPVPLTSFSADVYTQKDLLGIDRTVDALALLIASTRTDTPLSVGVFGPWGSGKSFFMRHLRKRVWTLAAREGDRIESWIQKRETGTAGIEDVPLYYDRIAQVEFNAWHYNEGNLVASLVDHLFRNLRVSPDEDKELEKRHAEIMQKITAREGDVFVTTAELNRTQKKVEVARDAVTNASVQVSSAQKDVAVCAKELNDRTALADEARKKSELAIQELSNSKAIDPGAVAAVAMSPLTDSTALKDAEAFGEQFARQIEDWRNFLADLFSLRGAIVLALCLAVPLVTWLTDWLDKTWAALTGVVMTGGASIAHVIQFVRERRKEYEAKMKELKAKEAAHVQGQIDRLRNEQTRIDAAWKQKLEEVRQALALQHDLLGKREAALLAAAKELATVSQDLDRKVQARTAAEQELLKWQAEIKKLSRGSLLDEFIQDRSATEDYRKELGFLALVRRDFERLSDLIIKANQEWSNPQQAKAAPPINRIVLYIDDLDRCKVDTVIKVLEVVHLLLAFPLFVCVVAVDPRWIEKCLREKHTHLFNTDNDGHATVGDYLEKIFQIPIWTQPISGRLRASLVKSLLGKTAAPPPQDAGTGTQAGPESPDAGQSENQPAAEGAPSDGFEETVALAEANRDPLRITREEALFVDRVAPLLSDKPRALKRFVNTYRLLKASLPAVDRPDFVSGNPSSPYKICMSQLAFFTGQPRLAPLLVRHLGNTNGGEGSLQTWYNGLAEEPRKKMEKAFALVPDPSELRLEDFRAWLPDTSRYLFHRDD